MLVLARKINESVIIDGRITVKIVGFDGDKVRLGIQAPNEVPAHREEVYREIQRNNHEAVHHGRPRLPRLIPPPVPLPTVPICPGTDAPSHAQT
jgi:carbon storage regulator